MVRKPSEMFAAVVAALGLEAPRTLNPGCSGSTLMHSRRGVLGLSVGLALPSLAGAASPDVDLVANVEATRSPPSFLKGNVLPLVLRPSYGVQAPDVYYPPWFEGRWRASSRLVSVNAPAGVEYFSAGGDGAAALERARSEIGSTLEYDVRWVRTADDKLIVDRAFNVESITRASMGAAAVQDTQPDGADHLTMYIRPSGGPQGGVFRAELQVVSRITDERRLPAGFACAETVRQSVLLVPGEVARRSESAPRVKEVDAICTYDAPVGGVMRGTQRTATFLVPDAAYTSRVSLAEQQAMASARGPDGRPIAVDLRHYELEYRRA